MIPYVERNGSYGVIRQNFERVNDFSPTHLYRNIPVSIHVLAIDRVDISKQLGLEIDSYPVHRSRIFVIFLMNQNEYPEGIGLMPEEVLASINNVVTDRHIARINAAVSYLQEGKIVQPIGAFAEPY